MAYLLKDRLSEVVANSDCATDQEGILRETGCQHFYIEFLSRPRPKRHAGSHDVPQKFICALQENFSSFLPRDLILWVKNLVEPSTSQYGKEKLCKGLVMNRNLVASMQRRANMVSPEPPIPFRSKASYPSKETIPRSSPHSCEAKAHRVRRIGRKRPKQALLG